MKMEFGNDWIQIINPWLIIGILHMQERTCYGLSEYKEYNQTVVIKRGK